MPAVIESQPFITKTPETAYHDFCRERLQKLYGASFQTAVPVNSFSQQLIMLNLSQGFAIIPEENGFETERLVAFPLDESFYETAQIICFPDQASGSLARLLQHIYEKKC